MLTASEEGLPCWGRKAEGLLLGEPLGGCGETETGASCVGAWDGDRLLKGRSGGVPVVVERCGVETTLGWKRTDCW